MKKTIILTSVILASFWANYSNYATGTILNEPEPDGAVKLIARTNKTTYLELEPIAVQLEIKNTSIEPKVIISPNFFDLQVEVSDHGGHSRRLLTSLVTVNRVSFPIKLGPGEALAHETILTTNLERMFNRPGDFEIKFVLPSLSTDATETKSEPISIRINEPAGSDAKAVRDIKRHQAESNAPDELFRWTGKHGMKDPEGDLTDFVSKHRNSPYGEYAILQLATVLVAKQAYGKAQTELNKLDRITNDVVRTQSKVLLNQISRKRAKEVVR